MTLIQTLEWAVTRKRVVWEEVEHEEQTHLVVELGECFKNKH